MVAHVIVPDFEHRPGVHCGSTAVADALRMAGVDLTEAMAFGLGAGLGFHYFTSPALSPSHVFHGRSAHLERTACQVVGVPARERTEDDPERAWEAARAAVDGGIAPILSTDLSELPYWRSTTPFGGHRVVLAGYDAEREIAFVADTGWPGLQEVPLDALRRARSRIGLPLGVSGNPWLEVLPGARPVPIPEAVRDALRRQAREILIDQDGSAGVSALERFADELPRWPSEATDARDFVHCLWHGYQMIERRGTGGGLFRALYAAFLREAEELVPSLRPLLLRSRMEALAARWSAVGAAMREGVRRRERALPDGLAALVREVAREERSYHEDVAALA